MNINVSEIYQEELKKLESEDFVRKQIRAGLEETISKTVKEAFTSYKFKNVISEKISKIANDSVQEIGFEGYSNYIKKSLIEQIAIVQKNTLESLIFEATKEYFESPSEIELYDLIEKFIEQNRNEDGEGYGEYMTVIIDNSFVHERQDGTKYGLVYVSLDEEKNKKEYSCKYRITFNAGESKIQEILIDGNKQNNKVIIGRIYDKFEAMLYKAYFNATKITGLGSTDSDDFDTRRCDGDY